MAIIVEDGSVVAGAQSYASVEQADVYFADRGITIWSNATAIEKGQALIRATDFMIQKYRMRWRGRRASVLQRLDWPRVGVVIDDFNGGQVTTYGVIQVSATEVPLDVKNACIELALRGSIGTLSEDQSQQVIQETIGPITIKYDQYSSSVPQFRQPADMLKPYLNANSGAMMKLGRC